VPDVHARTPFLNFYQKGDLVRAHEFLRLGAKAN
jgi:ankyrin repeat protein